MWTVHLSTISTTVATAAAIAAAAAVALLLGAVALALGAIIALAFATVAFLAAVALLLGKGVTHSVHRHVVITSAIARVVGLARQVTLRVATGVIGCALVTGAASPVLVHLDIVNLNWGLETVHVNLRALADMHSGGVLDIHMGALAIHHHWCIIVHMHMGTLADIYITLVDPHVCLASSFDTSFRADTNQRLATHINLGLTTH